MRPITILLRVCVISVLIGVPLFVVFFPLVVQGSAMWSVKRAILANVDDLVHDARVLLKETDTTQTGNIYMRDLPGRFSKLGDVILSMNPRHSHAVRVEVLSGFSHQGYFIVPEPSGEIVKGIQTWTSDHRARGRGLKKIHHNVYRYRY